MVRFIIRIFLLPVTLGLLDIVILVPLVLSISTVIEEVMHGQLHEAEEILEGVGVVLIGWGVAIEERPSLREMFDMMGSPKEAFEAGVDVLCHSSGIGLLIFGLFSEIAVAAVRLPNHIVPTEGVDHIVLYISDVFVAVGAYILGQHIYKLFVAVVWGRVPAPHHH
jgi:hypothetical protein